MTAHTLDAPTRAAAQPGNRSRTATFVLRVFLGVFFVFEGWDKVGWLSDSTPLVTALTNWSHQAAPISRWYLEHIAIPGAPLFARLVFVGEVATGIAFLLGVWTRPVAGIAFFMVLNFHFAHSRILEYAFLSQGDGLPVLGGLLALALAGDSAAIREITFRRKSWR